MPARPTAAILLPAFTAGALFLAAVQPGFAQPVETPAEACDRLAAHPDDTDRVGPGVAIEDVDLAAAEEACSAAIEADPEDRHSLFTLGRVLQYQADFPAAVALFERAAAAESAIATVWLGHVYWEGLGVAQDYVRALDYYRTGVELGSVEALLYIGFAYQLGLGVDADRSAAADNYRLAIEAGSDSARLYLADLLGGPGATDAEFAEAVAAYRELIDADGDLAPTARNNLAYAFAQRGENLDEAETLAMAAMETMPEDDLSLRSATLDTLASIRLQLGRPDEAFADIKGALAIDPSRIEHWDRLGDISLALDRVVDAIRAWEQSLALYLANPEFAARDWDADALRHKIDENLPRG